jgi:murein DD-endopeptidase MepM/ murein hydrolase activator NlpD
MKVITLLLLAGAVVVSALSQDKPSISPVSDRSTISREFGVVHHPMVNTDRTHDGVDFKVPEGTPVYATADGVVRQAGTVENYGMVVTIKHARGIQTFYAHLSKLAVKAGEKVKRGQVIAYSGNTGLSAGPHLHYEVRVKGEKVNPQNFME